MRNNASEWERIADNELKRIECGERDYRRCCRKSRTALASGGRRGRFCGKLLRQTELKWASPPEWSPPIAFAPTASSADPSSSSCYGYSLLAGYSQLADTAVWESRLTLSRLGRREMQSRSDLRRRRAIGIWGVTTNGTHTQFSLHRKLSLPSTTSSIRIQAKNSINEWNKQKQHL